MVRAGFENTVEIELNLIILISISRSIWIGCVTKAKEIILLIEDMDMDILLLSEMSIDCRLAFSVRKIRVVIYKFLVTQQIPFLYDQSSTVKCRQQSDRKKMYFRSDMWCDRQEITEYFNGLRWCPDGRWKLYMQLYYSP